MDCFIDNIIIIYDMDTKQTPNHDNFDKIATKNNNSSLCLVNIFIE